MNTQYLPASAVPTDEVTALVAAMDDAFAMAAHGQALQGRCHLEAGLHRALSLRQAGAPWAGSLESRYLKVLDRYLERYGMAAG
jgi:hypothetical protein